MNIVIISIYPFPNGGAATNRIISYSKSMILHDVNIDLILPFKTDYLKSGKTQSDSGEFEGIKYCFTNGRYKSRYKLVRGFLRFFRLHLLIGHVKSFLYLRRMSKIKNIDAIIISTDRISSLFTYSKLAHLIMSKSIFIFDEYPIPIRHKLKDKLPFIKTQLYKLVLRKIDAYISISQELNNFFNSLCEKPTFVLPIIVDTNRFTHIKSENKNSISLPNEYLCYMGNMELAKDNVDLIIRAFKSVLLKYPNLKLLLFGKPNKKDEIIITDLIKSFDLAGKVLLMGFIPSDEVPIILQKAKILLSSQPMTRRAKGGFPTKLAEYLLSGSPTLISDVGENSAYVKSGIHCYLVPPNDVESYSQKILEILNNYDNALEIAKNGRKFIMNNYSMNKNGRNLKHYIRKITNQNVER